MTLAQQIRELMGRATKGQFEDKFWAKVSVLGNNECWLWGGYRDPKGYGRLYQPGKGMRPAHRISWELFNGEDFPEGKISRHKCDNPSCVNPHHIEPGTLSENMQDCLSRGRFPYKMKAFCKKGHIMTPDNRATHGTQTWCLTCKRESSKKTQQKMRDRKRQLPTPPTKEDQNDA